MGSAQRLSSRRSQRRVPVLADMASGIRCCVVLSSCLFIVSAVRADCSTNDAERSAELTRSLVREGERAFTWRLAWTAINAGSTLLSFGGLAVLPRSDRPDLLLGAGVSTISTLLTWFWPMNVEADAKLAVTLEALPTRDRCTRLERLLEHSAADERERLTWPWHIGNFVTALLPAIAVWFAFHRRGEAVLSLLGSFASGEVELLTQPSALVDPGRHRCARISVDRAQGGWSIRAGLFW
jgi:hypothetical protein